MSPNPRTLMRPLVALLGLVLALVLAGCGGSVEPTAQDEPKTPATDTFPVTVEHKYGVTTIEAEPTRVVTLGLSDQDAVLALGVRPVGAVDWFKERPFGKWPWTKDVWGDAPPEVVGERDEFNVERIAALEPDLIIAQYSGMKKEQYDTLSQLAPVVAQPKGHDDYAAPWQDMARPIGRALGQRARMDELIAEIERRFARVRAEHPEFAERTAVVADSFEPGAYVAFARTDLKALLLTELGFRFPPAVDALVRPGQNVAEFSAERLDLLDVDRLVWLNSSTEANERIRAEPLYQRLDVVREGRDLFVPYQDPDIGAAISFNTVLSIPYAIDQLVPMLTAAR
ncbi:iron complex transport system substrate-binding protein [Amycolatopsis arida]|uniref:Iron complex transport system substrate-binding protein n=1 Tax=Amycolatopsis arida TaxID=587909 RepID=A0A1I5ZRP5_9PSEU|nr:iron-siderophore ABC transporter substrate-binding protein [Amycolatopsis arida]SFQ59159.1 iron complex transport system substrate-binding protein [Amycolatopsis arida]